MLSTITSNTTNPVKYEARPNPFGGYGVFGVEYDKKTGKEISCAPIMGYATLAEAQKASVEIAKINAPRPSQKVKHHPLPLPARKEIQAKLLTCNDEYAAAFYEQMYTGHVYMNLLTDWLDGTDAIFGEFEHPAIRQRRKNAMQAADGLLEDIFKNRTVGGKVGVENYGNWAVASHDIADIVNALVCYSRTSGGDTGLIAQVKAVINKAMPDETRQRIREENANGVHAVIARDLGWLTKEEVDEIDAKIKNSLSE